MGDGDNKFSMFQGPGLQPGNTLKNTTALFHILLKSAEFPLSQSIHAILKLNKNSLPSLEAKHTHTKPITNLSIYLTLC